MTPGADTLEAGAADEAAPDAASLADALAQIAGAFLAGKIATAANPDIFQVILHVGAEALTADAQPSVTPGPSPRPSPSPRQIPRPGHGHRRT